MALRSSEEFRREETSESSLGARCEGLGCYLRQHGAPMRFRSPLKSYTLKTLYLPALAGAAGFEPAHGGTKSRCLTTWLRPNRGRTLIPARRTGKSPRPAKGGGQRVRKEGRGQGITRLRKIRPGDIHRVAGFGV